MAQFHGKIIGQRRETSTVGNKGSGLSIRAGGYNIGAQIELSHDLGEDIMVIYVTSGSYGKYARKEILRLSEKNLAGFLTRHITGWREI